MCGWPLYIIVAILIRLWLSYVQLITIEHAIFMVEFSVLGACWLIRWCCMFCVTVAMVLV